MFAMDYIDENDVDDQSQSDFDVLSEQIWAAWAEKGRNSILERKAKLLEKKPG